MNENEINELWHRAKAFYPIHRSITGDGVRATLALIQRELPLIVHAVPSGYRAFDWVVPPEWHFNAGWVKDDTGQKIIDTAQNNLHILGYSIPFDGIVGRQELLAHLYSNPALPSAIPYVTSYYQERWGFAVTDQQKQAIAQSHCDKFQVFIDSRLDSGGQLNYGEVYLAGASPKEILLSTNICHPSMANNETSGLTVLTQLMKYLAGQKLPYSVRALFIPETIGSLVFLSQNLPSLVQNCFAGYALTCIGDDRTTSYVATKDGHSLSDRAARYVLARIKGAVQEYSFLHRGSDERQFNSVGIDLPIGALSRTKHAVYPEYHSSADDFSLVTQQGLWGGYQYARDCVRILLANRTPRMKVKGEPQLGRRGLYHTLSQFGNYGDSRAMMNIIAYSDGRHDYLALCQLLSLEFEYVEKICEELYNHNLLEFV